MKYKKLKVTKLWTPLVCFLLLTLALLLINFNYFSYVLDNKYYVNQRGTVLEHNTDNLFFVIPMVKISWVYDGESYTEEKLDFTNKKQVDIAVNKKAPNFCLLLSNDKLEVPNLIMIILWGTMLCYLVRYFIIRNNQKLWKKCLPNIMQEASKIDIWKGEQ